MVSVSPEKKTCPPPGIGETFTINITITNATDLYTWQAGVTFNATVLEAINFTEGPFLKQLGDTLWVDGTINNTAGIIYYHGCTLTGNVTGANGNGTLGLITFKVEDYGHSTLQPTDVILLDSILEDIDKTVIHGTVFVTILGDLTGPDDISDGKVDVYDLNFLGKAYGAKEGDLNWDEYKIADVTGPYGVPDGIVDTHDLPIYVENYGKTIH